MSLTKKMFWYQVVVRKIVFFNAIFKKEFIKVTLLQYYGGYMLLSLTDRDELININSDGQN